MKHEVSSHICLRYDEQKSLMHKLEVQEISVLHHKVDEKWFWSIIQETLTAIKCMKLCKVITLSKDGLPGCNLGTIDQRLYTS